MEWRGRVLSELVAGVELGLPGLDFSTPEIRGRLVAEGIFAPGPPPDAGAQVRVNAGGLDEWRTLVPAADGYLAHPDRDGAKAIHLTEAEAVLFSLDRVALYRRMATELGCRRAEPEMHAPGVWTIGVRHLPNVGSAKVMVVERGASRSAVERSVRQAAFKWLCVLGIGGAVAGMEALGAETGKSIFGGGVESNGDRFFAPALDDLDAIQPPPHGGARIDLDEKPPLLVVNGVSLRLPMHGSEPATGVLLLNHLFEHPCAVIPGWKLESDVFPEKRCHQDMAFGTDAVADEKAVASIRADAEKAARELAALRRKSDASESEIKAAKDEVDRLMDALDASRAPGGRKKQLGESSAERARQRVKNNLRKVFDEVRKQDARIGEQLKSAVRQGYEVMFLPPPDWGM